MSAKPVRNPRTRELARIHCLAKQQGLDRDTYEAMLWTVARVKSARDLDAHGRRAVLAHLQPRQPTRFGRTPATLGNRALLRKIEAQLAAAKRPWGYAEALARRIAHKQRLEFCTDAELGKIVAALSYDAARKTREIA